MEEINKKEEVKQKKKINWTAILIFFLLGFVITLPGIMIKLLPAHSGKIIKFGDDLFILKNNGIVYHYSTKKGQFNLVEKFGNDDGNTYSNIEMLFTGSGVVINKGDKVDLIKYNIKNKHFEYEKTVQLE